TVDEAIAILRKARPAIVLRDRHRRALGLMTREAATARTQVPNGHAA
ncbi:MAG: hypothetical protein JF591_21575, partial [Lysobacter sp.]|nr:hypothetical protein [Lysobacter sp.]